MGQKRGKIMMMMMMMVVVKKIENTEEFLLSCSALADGFFSAQGTPTAQKEKLLSPLTL